MNSLYELCRVCKIKSKTSVGNVKKLKNDKFNKKPVNLNQNIIKCCIDLNFFANNLKTIRNELNYRKEDFDSFEVFMDDVVTMIMTYKPQMQLTELLCDRISPSYIDSYTYYPTKRKRLSRKLGSN